MEPESVAPLLELRMAVSRDGEVAVAVPAEHTAAIGYFEARRFRRTEELIRMTKGVAVDWDPTKIWACFNLALG